MAKTKPNVDEMFLAGMRGERKGLHPANLDGLAMRAHQHHERHAEARRVLETAVRRGLSRQAESDALDWLCANAYACDGCGNRGVPLAPIGESRHCQPCYETREA